MATTIVIHSLPPARIKNAPVLPSLFFPQWDAILLGSKGAILDIVSFG